VRQHQSLVASYLQRYCAKNDTIGFFGPMSWSQIDDDPGIRITHAADGSSLAARITYLEGWAVRAIMADHATALRPWLVPRRMPFLGVDGTLLRLPLTPAMPLTPAEAAIMRASDGTRDARAVAAAVLADPSAGLRDVAEVYALMGRLADSRRLAWQVDVAPQDTWPERSMGALLARVTDDSVRGPAEKALDELTAARDELARAAGDAEQVAVAMAGLEETFTRLAGVPPTRRAGELYAGRTVAYEECQRAGTLRLGADAPDPIWPASRRRSPGWPASRPRVGRVSSMPAVRSPMRSASALARCGWARTPWIASARRWRWYSTAHGGSARPAARCSRGTSTRPTGSEPLPSAPTSCRSPTSGCSSTTRCSTLSSSSSPCWARCGGAGWQCWICRLAPGGSSSGPPTCASGGQRSFRASRGPGRRA